jgi:hypothetical protein
MQTTNRPDTAERLPDLPLILELHKPLAEALNKSGRGETLREAIEREVKDLLATLGIPGNPLFQMSPLDGASPVPKASRFMRLSVHGRRARFPDELLRFVHSYVNGALPKPEVELTDLFRSLTNACANDLAAPSLVEFFSLTCVEVLKRQPEILFEKPQADAYGASLPPPMGAAARTVSPPASPFLLSVLKEALRLKLSIADRQKVASVLHKGWAAGRAIEDISEDLIAELSPGVLEIQFTQDLLRQMTVDWEETSLELFPFLRDGMFEELGMTYPQFRFVLEERLKPNSFALKVNHLPTLAFHGLRGTECLANDTADRVKVSLDVDPTPTINPATGQPASIIDRAEQRRAEEQGLTTWNQIQFLILCLAERLRKHGFCLVHRSAVQEQLSQLERAFPSLVKAARSRVSDERITRILRELIREEVSIRNLRGILEHLLDYDLLTEASKRNSRDELTGPLSFVRAALRRQIGHKAGRSVQTIVVYLVDQHIEQLAAEQPSLALSTRADEILEAFWTEFRHLPPTAMVPNVLTSSQARPILHEIIALEFPRISVIAHEELPPDATVQPVARISLTPVST